MRGEPVRLAEHEKPVEGRSLSQIPGRVHLIVHIAALDDVPRVILRVAVNNAGVDPRRQAQTVEGVGNALAHGRPVHEGRVTGVLQRVGVIIQIRVIIGHICAEVGVDRHDLIPLRHAVKFQAGENLSDHVAHCVLLLGIGVVCDGIGDMDRALTVLAHSRFGLGSPSSIGEADVVAFISGEGVLQSDLKDVLHHRLEFFLRGHAGGRIIEAAIRLSGFKQSSESDAGPVGGGIGRFGRSVPAVSPSDAPKLGLGLENRRDLVLRRWIDGKRALVYDVGVKRVDVCKAVKPIADRGRQLQRNLLRLALARDCELGLLDFLPPAAGIAEAVGVGTRSQQVSARDGLAALGVGDRCELLSLGVVNAEAAQIIRLPAPEDDSDARCGDLLAAGKNLAADRADRACRAAGLVKRGGNRLDVLGRVLRRGDLLAAFEDLAADGADRARRMAGPGAGRGDRRDRLGLVRRKRKLLAAFEDLAADGADRACRMAMRRAGRGDRRDRLGLVSRERKLLAAGENLAADRADRACRMAIRRAGRGDRLDLLRRMAERVRLLRGVAVLAEGTYKRGITALRAGRLCHLGNIVMLTRLLGKGGRRHDRQAHGQHHEQGKDPFQLSVHHYDVPPKKVSRRVFFRPAAKRRPHMERIPSRPAKKARILWTQDKLIQRNNSIPGCVKQHFFPAKTVSLTLKQFRKTISALTSERGRMPVDLVSTNTNQTSKLRFHPCRSGRLWRRFSDAQLEGQLLSVQEGHRCQR